MKEPELNQDITILSKITGFVWVSPNIFSPHEMNLNDLDALKEPGHAWLRGRSSASMEILPVLLGCAVVAVR